jgi:hypothetical protein
MATRDRHRGAIGPFRNGVFQQLLIAKASELTAVSGNFNR